LLRELIRSSERVLAIELVLVTVKDFGFALKQILDLFIEQESFTEILDLLPDEFVKLVHNIGQDTNTVLTDVVDHLLDTDGLQLLRVCGTLMENLSVQVVMVVLDVPLCFSQQKHDINTLLNLLWWEMRSQYTNVQLVFTEHTDVLISSVIVGPECIHLVENLGKVIPNLILDRDLLFKKVQVIHLGPSLHIDDLRLQWVGLFHVGDQYLMDLLTKFFFCLLANRVHNKLREGFVHIFLVVVNCDLR